MLSVRPFPSLSAFFRLGNSNLRELLVFCGGGRWKAPKELFNQAQLINELIRSCVVGWFVGWVGERGSSVLPGLVLPLNSQSVVKQQPAAGAIATAVTIAHFIYVINSAVGHAG